MIAVCRIDSLVLSRYGDLGGVGSGRIVGHSERAMSGIPVDHSREVPVTSTGRASPKPPRCPQREDTIREMAWASQPDPLPKFEKSPPVGTAYP